MNGGLERKKLTPGKVGLYTEVFRDIFDLPSPGVTEYIYGYGKTEEALKPLFDWPERKRWIIELESPPGKYRQYLPQLATVRLLPGVSIKEAKKAAALAVEKLGQRNRGHRPPTPHPVVSLLHRVFEAAKPEINKRGVRTGLVTFCQIGLANHYGVRVSKSTIEAELLSWLRQQKETIKRYVRE